MYSICFKRHIEIDIEANITIKLAVLELIYHFVQHKAINQEQSIGDFDGCGHGRKWRLQPPCLEIIPLIH